MEAYSDFANVYDGLMHDVPYDTWADNLEEVFRRLGVKPKRMIELACGTGNLTNLLAKKGYDMLGVDISEEMLTIAQGKAFEQNIKVKYLNQDMRELDYSKKVEAVISFCDGINYITEDEDLLDVFESVHGVLEDEGVFIFDISSYYKLKNILGNNVIAESEEDVAFIWENYFDDETSILEFDLTIFEQQGALYRRSVETHVQRAYRVDEILKMVHNNFSVKYVLDCDTLSEDVAESERILFVCTKI